MPRQQPSLFSDGGATFSPCRRYRYTLWREWADGDRIAFCGLNPSTADEHVDDNTVRRCIRFARRWGFGGMWMLNAYGFRSTDPRGLLAVPDPVGDGNDDAITTVARQSAGVVVCWGGNCTPHRQEAVLQLLSGIEIYCFGENSDGTPKHPLYLKSDTDLSLFREGR